MHKLLITLLLTTATTALAASPTLHVANGYRGCTIEPVCAKTNDMVQELNTKLLKKGWTLDTKKGADFIVWLTPLGVPTGSYKVMVWGGNNVRIEEVKVKRIAVTIVNRRSKKWIVSAQQVKKLKDVQKLIQSTLGAPSND